MLKELITRFGFEIDDKGLKDLQEGIDAAKEGILHLGEALVGEAVSLYELVTKTAEAGVELKHMSQESGIAADRLQELQFRAKLTDVSTQELNQSMFFLNRNLNEARNGSEQARKHFRLLGISVQELRSGTLTTDQVLQRIAKTFDKLPDGPRKAGFAAEVFGRSGARMIPFLHNLNEALDPVNAKILQMSLITQEEIEASEAFHTNVETLKMGLLGIARVIGFGLMPTATQVVETMKKWIVVNRELIVSNLTEFVKGMANALKLTLAITDALVKSFAGFAHAIGGVRIATELMLGGFAVLSGVTVLFGIGKVIQAVVELGNSFAIANLKAAIIPVAIGAAMVALLLIMEDIYSFFNGKKSFTGDLLNKLPEIGKAFKAVFEPIFGPIVTLITKVQDGLYSWKDIFKQLGVILVNVLLTPIRAIVSQVGGLSSVIGRIFGNDTLKKFGSAALDTAGNIKLDDVVPSSIGPKGALSAQGGASKQVNNDINQTLEFNFPPGTEPTSVSDKIQGSVSSGLDEVLRKTNQSTYDGGSR